METLKVMELIMAILLLIITFSEEYDSTRLTHLHYFGLDTWGNKMYLNWYSQNDFITNGNIGIGTTSPGAKLEISAGNVKMKTNNFIKSL